MRARLIVQWVGAYLLVGVPEITEMTYHFMQSQFSPAAIIVSF